MTVGLLQEGDAASLIFCTSYLSEHWSISRAEADALVRSGIEHCEGSFCLIAKIGAQPVGMLLSHAREPRLHPTWGPWVSGWFIVPEHRNSTFALRMLRQVQSILRDRGVMHVYLDSVQPRLQRFYGRMGFAVVGTSEWNGSTALIYRADLRPAA